MHAHHLFLGKYGCLQTAEQGCFMRLSANSGFAIRTTFSICIYNVVYECMVLFNSLFIGKFAASFSVGAGGIAKVGYSNGFPGHSDRPFQRTDMDGPHRACKWFRRLSCDYANRFVCVDPLFDPLPPHPLLPLPPTLGTTSI